MDYSHIEGWKLISFHAQNFSLGRTTDWPPTKDADIAVKANCFLSKHENKSWKFWLYFTFCNPGATWFHFTEKSKLLLSTIAYAGCMHTDEFSSNDSSCSRLKFRLVSMSRRELHSNSGCGENTLSDLNVIFRSGDWISSIESRFNPFF